jgi:hypothetical protein
MEQLEDSGKINRYLYLMSSKYDASDLLNDKYETIAAVS